MFEYKAKLIEIVDGDTFWLDVDVGFHLHFKWKFRLARVNAPELFSLEGVKAKQFVVDALAGVSDVVVHTSRSEKYGRWLCELYFVSKRIPGPSICLNDLLLQSGHAVKYRH